jgi:hypothetical protein
MRRKDEMIQEGDAEQCAGGGDPLGDLVVLWAGAGIAARVVVSKDDCRCADEDGRLEDLARMNKGLVRRSDRHDLTADRPMTCVKVDREEVLPSVDSNDHAREARCGLGVMDLGIAAQRRALVLDADLAEVAP